MLTILHLSDIHFGQLLPSQQKPDQSASAHVFAAGDVPLPEELAKAIASDPELQMPPDAVIVSGDIGWSGQAEDYRYAAMFFAALRDRWPNVPIAIAPGNHDVDRGSAGAGKRQDAFIDFLTTLLPADFDRQYAPYKDKPSRERLIGVERIKTPRGDDVLIVAINSAALLEDKSTPVVVTVETLEAVEQLLRDLKLPETTLRLFVLHHHLLPFAEPGWSNVRDPRKVPDTADPSTVANSAKLQSWLVQHGFQVVLHGHKHMSHGRADVLWRHRDKEGRRLVIIGAGSAGVEGSHRAPLEPLSYNIIRVTRLSSCRWTVDVSVRQIGEGDAVIKPDALYTYSSDVGASPDGEPAVFQAERLDDCHAAIAKSLQSAGLVRNFVSIVNDSTWREVQTARIGTEQMELSQIERSFAALHPEYAMTEEWHELDRMEAPHETTARFRFQHGPRLFGLPHYRVEHAENLRPIVAAVAKLRTSSVSSAYVSLFDRDVDVTGREPMPALMSIQFIRAKTHLDLVATFRKIELSFWWVVNMYELGKILGWAAGQAKLLPGRVSFFAALAEWKTDPEPAFVSRIDSTPLSDLLAMSAHALSGDVAAQKELAVLLSEKGRETNENNLDASGLKQLAGILRGLGCESVTPAHVIPDALSHKLDEAIKLIEKAMERDAGQRSRSITKARDAIGDCVRLIHGAATNAAPTGASATTAKPTT